MHYLVENPAGKSWFTARHSGYSCVSCGHRITPGEKILLSQVHLVESDAEGGYLRRDCCKSKCVVVERRFLKVSEHLRTGIEVEPLDDNLYDLDGNVVTE